MRRILFSISVLVILGGCNSYTAKDSGTPIVSGSSVPDYATVQANVFKPYCISCHSNSGGNSGSVNLETYANVAANISKIQDQAVVKKTMPPSGPMPSAQQQLLVTWISYGYPETVSTSPTPTPVNGGGNTPTPTPNPGTSVQATYSALAQNLFQAQCVRCHGPGGSESTYPLDSYQNIMNTGWITAGSSANSRLYNAVAGGSMPPGGGVSQAYIDALKSWIDSGASNN